jgi:hypothetical protein
MSLLQRPLWEIIFTPHASKTKHHNPPDDTQIRMVRALGFPSVLKQIINEETQ